MCESWIYIFLAILHWRDFNTNKYVAEYNLYYLANQPIPYGIWTLKRTVGYFKIILVDYDFMTAWQATGGQL